MDGSFLRITIHGIDFNAKVNEFSSDLTSSINSVQTRTAQQHFPFKNDQSSLSLALQMRDQEEAKIFQSLVRLSQVDALGAANMANFFWPQRGMMDWKGAIMSIQSGERVAQTSPIIVIDVMLVESMISSRTWASSIPPEFKDIYEGQEIPDVPLLEPNRHYRDQTGETGAFSPPTSMPGGGPPRMPGPAPSLPGGQHVRPSPISDSDAFINPRNP